MICSLIGEHESLIPYSNNKKTVAVCCYVKIIRFSRRLICLSDLLLKDVIVSSSYYYKELTETLI